MRARLDDSDQKGLARQDEMRLLLCLDDGPNGRASHRDSTVVEEMTHGIHIGVGWTREDFILVHNKGDQTQAMPKPIIPSLQVKMRGGDLPSFNE
ncbi:hypothetical protein [Rhodobacter calidifons]|nr:hypothetical protein [Rhodobacter calidifons]